MANVDELMKQYNDGLRDGFELAITYLEALLEPNRNTIFMAGLRGSIDALKTGQTSQEVLRKKD